MKFSMQKWKQGIANITPLQQLQSTQKGNWVMLVGIICGIIVMGFKAKEFWWIEIILVASLFNHSLMMIGIQQKIKMITKLESEVENV